jgi:hypothetical protein
MIFAGLAFWLIRYQNNQNAKERKKFFSAMRQKIGELYF